MILLGLLGACLISTDLYRERVDALTDHDGDGFVKERECDDADDSVYPGAPERCDGVDQDCDGEVDEDAVDASSWFGDRDGDGWGDEAAETVACAAPDSTAARDGDCDDQDAAVHPDADETPYDGVDDDCDGADLVDVDGDGHASTAAGGGDCDDGDAGTHPGAVDEPYDGVDQDCVDGDRVDLDGDGHPSDVVGGDDCDDARPEIHAGADETWADGVTDNDCDGELESVRLEYGAEVWVGPSEGAQAGRRIGDLGDITGDGLAEYLVGAVYDSSAYTTGGAVYIVPGGVASGDLADTPTLLPGGASWYLPGALDGGPDIDGDAVPDLVASAAGYGDGAGVVFLVSGASLPTSGERTITDLAIAVVEGDTAEDYAGSAAVFLGDIMGDGSEWLAVGAPYAATAAGVDAGRVGLFDVATLGSTTLADADVVIDGYFAGSVIGNTIAPAGDVDGDGVEDYMLSAASGDAAYVVQGGDPTPELPGDALFRLYLGSSESIVSSEMLGDVDGDGRQDLGCVVDYTEFRTFTLLTSNPVRGLDDASTRIDLGEGSYTYDVLGLGDIDARGRGDILIAVQWYPPVASSLLAVFFGEDLAFGDTVGITESKLTAVSLRPAGRFGYRVHLSTDVNGDGGGDILVGGYSDSAGGSEAGATVTVPVPQ